MKRRHTRSEISHLLWAAACLGAAVHAGEVADTVVITGPRVPEPRIDLPMSVDRVEQQQIQQGQLQVNLSESLDELPGVSAQQRQNYAQDLQVSVRGFGARSSFGVRGVRLYTDGIPATMPDGQGQFSHFDLGSADRIEVLRGPFSSLYGNSSGGVIAIFTQDAPPQPSVEASVTGGSLGTQRYALKAMGQPGGVNVVLDAAHFATDGYREHSEAERNTFNGKAAWQLDERSKLTLIANIIRMPDAQDPLGLTRTQMTQDPQQAGTNAIAYNTRKSVSQQQGGVNYEHRFGESDTLVVMAYGGQRQTTQYQAIPRSVELAHPTHPGGVIDLDRSYGGADVHYSALRSALGGALRVTGGVSYDNLDEARKGFLNFVGDQLGVEGELRRDESNRVYDLDEYLQAQWDSQQRWLAMVGMRNSVVDTTSHDELAPASTSGESSVRYSAFTPVAGLTYRVAPRLSAYAAYGKGFETPTLNELAYRSTDGSLPGLNLGLQPAHSDNYELGLKSAGTTVEATLAGFYISTHDELAVLSSAGGRTVYHNIVDTERTGAELAAHITPTPSLMARLAYTYIEAIAAHDKRLPAVAANTVYAALTWSRAARDFSITLETLGRDHFYVDDANSDAAAGYWLASLHGDLSQRRGAWRFNESIRIDNLTDRTYVGSVIVNEANSRFFEPGPGRTVYVMLSAAY